MVTNFSGLASGIDFNALIDASSAATRQQRVAPLQKDITRLTETNDALKALKERLSKLNTKLETFRTINLGGIQKQVSSSNETVLTGAASNSAAVGTYSITVNQLARAGSSLFDNTYATQDTAMVPAINDSNTDAQRTLSISVGTGANMTTKSIILTSTTSIYAFSVDFNAKFIGKATSSIVNVGTETTPSYQVLIKADNTGVDKGTIAYAVDGSPDAGLDAFANATNRTDTLPLNADLTMTGIPGTITKGSNTVSDLLTGVTLNLESTGTSTFKVAVDSTATRGRVSEFVEAWNGVVDYVNENDQLTADTDAQGNPIASFLPLANTGVDNSFVEIWRTEFSSTVVSSTSATIRTFGDIGLTTNGAGDGGQALSGRIQIDDPRYSSFTTFNKALTAEPNSVDEILRTFADKMAGTGGKIFEFTKFLGLIDKTVTYNQEEIDRKNRQISELEKSISQQEAASRTRYASLEALMGKLQSQQSQLTSSLAGLR